MLILTGINNKVTEHAEKISFQETDATRGRRHPGARQATRTADTLHGQGLRVADSCPKEGARNQNL